MSELPDGWVRASLGELCEINPKHPKELDRSMQVSFIPMPAVSDELGVVMEHDHRPLDEIWKGYTHFQEGDVIFAKITPCMENGKIAVAKGLANGIACGSTEFLSSAALKASQTSSYGTFSASKDSDLKRNDIWQEL